MPQVFISYSHVDQDFALYFAYRLSLYGINIWIDESRLFAGDVLHGEIRRGLEASDALVFIVSPDSLVSENVTIEWTFFLEEFPNRLLIPVICRSLGQKKLPDRISRLVYVNDFMKINGFSSGLYQILQSLKNRGLEINSSSGFSTGYMPTGKLRPFNILDPQLTLKSLSILIDLLKDAKAFYEVQSIDYSKYQKRSFWLLVEDKIKPSGLWESVSIYFKSLVGLFSDVRFPMYMNDFWVHLAKLLSRESIVLTPTEPREIVGYLPPDGSSFDLLLTTAESGLGEYIKRTKTRRNYHFPLDKVCKAIQNAQYDIYGMSSVQPEEKLLNTESRIKLRIGEYKVHWNYEPTTREIDAVERLAQNFVDEYFWFISTDETE